MVGSYHCRFPCQSLSGPPPAVEGGARAAALPPGLALQCRPPRKIQGRVNRAALDTASGGRGADCFEA